MAEWNEWDIKQKGEQLVMSFDGEAMKLLGELSSDILHDYELLVLELNRRFDPVERAQAWKIEFRNRKRVPNETIMQYAQALKRIVIKAFPNMHSSAQEQWVLDQFSLGLGNIDVQRHVQFGHPKDLNAAISLAIEYEAFEAGTKDKFRKPANTLAEVAEVCAVGDRYQSNQSSKSSNFDLSNVECRYCKKKGHFKNDCRKLKWKLEQRTQEEGSEPKPNTEQGN